MKVVVQDDFHEQVLLTGLFVPEPVTDFVFRSLPETRDALKKDELWEYVELLKYRFAGGQQDVHIEIIAIVVVDIGNVALKKQTSKYYEVEVKKIPSSTKELVRLVTQLVRSALQEAKTETSQALRRIPRNLV